MATPQQNEQATSSNNEENAEIVKQKLAHLSKGPKNLFKHCIEW
jgi:hypothetical protein